MPESEPTPPAIPTQEDLLKGESMGIQEILEQILSTIDWSPVIWLILITIAAYAIAVGFSGRIVGFFVGTENRDSGNDTDGEKPSPRTYRRVPWGRTCERFVRIDTPAKRRFKASTIIGKCENILTVSFILAGEETGLALIIAAKSLVRSEAIKEDPGYYLGGTLVNLVWSLLVAFVARSLLIIVS